jgi:sigma-B regulation protein RsbU (phosphoserine phosphatase)
MPFSSPRFLSQSSFIRRFLTSQTLNVAVAIALFALLWVVNWRRADFAGILIYSVVAGSVTMAAMKRMAPVFMRLSLFYHWLVYLCLLFLAALGSSILSVAVIMLVFQIPYSQFGAEFWLSGRLGTMVITLVGIPYHLYTESRRALEMRNLELQRTVDVAQTHSQQQGQELEKAREIQEGLLPKKIPQVKGLEVAGAWQPARVVGGDYYDVLKFSERKIGICIGDVVGKGITAALLMANLQASFRAFAEEGVSPGALCGKLHGVISNNVAQEKFVTFCYCTIDAEKNKLTYASAGHCPPLLLRGRGEAISLKEGGTPLGILPGKEYADTEVQLEAGDRLVLYTDGLTEAMNADDEEFGEARLVGLGRKNTGLSAAELLEVIRKEVSGFSGGSFQDDFTLVVVAVK